MFRSTVRHEDSFDLAILTAMGVLGLLRSRLLLRAPRLSQWRSLNRNPLSVGLQVA